MTTRRVPVRIVLLVLAPAFLALPAAAARKNDDPLSLVPPDAAAVGVVRWNEIKASPLGSRLLSETDHMTVDGDAARFMAEARLNPREDVDVIVVAGSPAACGEGSGSGLALFAGRFDAGRLAEALEARGGMRKTAPGGDYFLLPRGERDRGRPGALAFASSRLVIGGDEASVVAALERRQSGGNDFASRAALGREFARIRPAASAWALVEVRRFTSQERARVRPSGQAGELVSAMKSVTVIALQATVSGDALELAAAGVADNDETRQLLEDSVRGLLAMWRLAVQEKSPEAVAALRRFKVGSDGQAVTIQGVLTGDMLRSLAERRAQK